MTIDEVVRRNKAAGRHFFDDGALRFFGQRLSDYRVFNVDGRVFVFCGEARGWDSDCGLSTFEEFDTTTARCRGVHHPKGAYHYWRLDEVEHLMDVIREDADATRREKDALPIK